MVAPSEATVLIKGESGTGKELVARKIHNNSFRKNNPLTIVNCAALTETLLESELFGHEKGAFTGAEKKYEGRFMQANKGTIFLDEIGETSLNMQAKLLRVIQEKEIQRIGSEKTLKVDIRILAATNRDLEKEVLDKKFREDLYYRLNVVTVQIPPLRERKNDIPLLANHFLIQYAEKNRKNVQKIDSPTMEKLVNHNWPGNVRELENAIERAVILLQGDVITERELPLSITQSIDKLPSTTSDIPKDLSSKSLEEIEKDAILEALKTAGGNKSKAARLLKLNRRTLYSKLERFGISKV
jgi:two-component system response regulator HydG